MGAEAAESPCCGPGDVPPGLCPGFRCIPALAGQILVFKTTRHFFPRRHPPSHGSLLTATARPRPRFILKRRGLRDGPDTSLQMGLSPQGSTSWLMSQASRGRLDYNKCQIRQAESSFCLYTSSSNSEHKMCDQPTIKYSENCVTVQHSGFLLAMRCLQSIHFKPYVQILKTAVHSKGAPILLT